MHTNTESERGGMGSTMLRSRRFVILLVLFSCRLFYRAIRRPDSRFHVPRDFVMQHSIFGRAGLALDVFCYIAVVFVSTGMVRSTRNKAEALLFIGWVGPVVINPLRMAIPIDTSWIWWVEISLQAMFICVHSNLAKSTDHGRAAMN
jgi:hypothetical protein